MNAVCEMALNVSSQRGNHGPDGSHSDSGGTTAEPEADEYSFYRSFVAAAAAQDPSLAAALGLQAEEQLQDDKQPAAAATAAAPVSFEAAAASGEAAGAAGGAAAATQPGSHSARAQAAAGRSFVKPDFTRAQIRSLRRLHGSIQAPAVKPSTLMVSASLWGCKVVSDASYERQRPQRHHATGVGEYQLLEQLGQGAHGTAFKALHLPSGRLVCIKSVASDQASSNQQLLQPLEPQLTQLELRKREVAVLAALDHPGIVRYLDSFVDDAKQQLFIVMELLDGGDLLSLLQQRAKAGEPLSEEELLGLFVQVLLALAHIHAMAILHRDLKCNNIFVSSAGLLKLGDFGLAKVLEGGGCSSSGSTAGGDALVVSQQSGPVAHSFVGTPNLLAPEMVSCSPYNQRADVWALGCVLFQMATGRPAFKANNVALIYRMIRRSEAPQLPSRYSPALRQLHASLMAKDPNLRPSTADILALHAELLRPHLERYTALLQQLGLQLPPLPRATTDLTSAASSSNGGTALARSHMSSGAGGSGSTSEHSQASSSNSRSLHSSPAIAGTATAVAPWRQQLVSEAAAAAAQQAGHPKHRSTTTLLGRLRKRLAKAATRRAHTSSAAPLPPPPQQQQQQREVWEAAEGDGLPGGGRPAQLVAQLLPPLRHALSTVMSAGSGELEGASGGGACGSQQQASSDGPSRLSNQAAAAPTARTGAAAALMTTALPAAAAARPRWSSMLAAAGLGVCRAVPAETSLTAQRTSSPAAACTPPTARACHSAEACAPAAPSASSLPQEALLHMQELAARYTVQQQQQQQQQLQRGSSGLSTITERSEVSRLTQLSASFSSSIEQWSSSPMRSPCGQQWLTGAAAAAHLEAQDEQRGFGRGQQAATPPLQSPRFASPLQTCSRSPELQPAAATPNAVAGNLAQAEPAAAGPQAAAALLTQSEDVLVVITPTVECKGTMPSAATLVTEQLAMQERLQQLRLRLCRSASVSPAATWGSLE